VRITAQERFWSRVDKSHGKEPQSNCWVWTGGLDAEGYGVFYIGNKRWQAHRFAWELAHGPIPCGQKICHRCDNPPCVREDHLFCGTQRENVLDAARKGRLKAYKKGADHHNARKSHCKNGHLFTPENTLLREGKWRRCLTCRDASNARVMAKTKARRIADSELR